MAEERKKTKRRIIIICIALAAFGVILWAVVSGRAAGFDDAVRYAFYSVRCAGLTAAAKVFSAVGSWWGITILCLIILIIPKTRIRAGIPAVLAAMTTQAAEKILKPIIGRDRPSLSDRILEQTGFSFPSGHSVTSMGVFLILIYVVRTQIKDDWLKNILTVLLAIPMICVGLSRIYVGVHYPTDVLAGWAIAIAITTACILIFEDFNEKKAGQIKNSTAEKDLR